MSKFPQTSLVCNPTLYLEQFKLCIGLVEGILYGPVGSRMQLCIPSHLRNIIREAQLRNYYRECR